MIQVEHDTIINSITETFKCLDDGRVSISDLKIRDFIINITSSKIHWYLIPYVFIIHENLRLPKIRLPHPISPLNQESQFQFCDKFCSLYSLVNQDCNSELRLPYIVRWLTITRTMQNPVKHLKQSFLRKQLTAVTGHFCKSINLKIADCLPNAPLKRMEPCFVETRYSFKI